MVFEESNTKFHYNISHFLRICVVFKGSGLVVEPIVTFAECRDISYGTIAILNLITEPQLKKTCK